MSCPLCHSQAVATGVKPWGEYYSRCSACGHWWTDDVAENSDDSDDFEDNCALDGHEWREDYIADGSSCAICVRCGFIDC